MNKVVNKTVWVLTETEYAGQCTGFADQERLICIFEKKPSIMELSPMVGRNLSKDMGVALSQICYLVDEGSFSPSDWLEVELKQVKLGEFLL